MVELSLLVKEHLTNEKIIYIIVYMLSGKTFLAKKTLHFFHNIYFVFTNFNFVQVFSNMVVPR